MALFFAWGFGLARVVHAAIYLTCKHPLHRFYAFLAGNCMVLGQWLGIVSAAT